MRVVLKEGAARATAETILVLDGFAEAVWVPLLPTDRTTVAEGFVADVDELVVQRAITAAVRESRHPVSARRLFGQVRRMARITDRYVIGSRILLHVTRTGCRLDCSKAILTTAAAEERRSRCTVSARRPT